MMLNNEVLRAITVEQLRKAFAMLEVEETPYEAKVRRVAPGVWQLTIRCNDRPHFAAMLRNL